MTKKSKIILGASLAGAAVIAAGIPLFAWGVQTAEINRQKKSTAYEALSKFSNGSLEENNNNLQTSLKDLNTKHKALVSAEKTLTSAESELSSAQGEEAINAAQEKVNAAQSAFALARQNYKEEKTKADLLFKQTEENLDKAGEIVSYDFGKENISLGSGDKKQDYKMKDIAAKYILAVKKYADLKKGYELSNVNWNFPQEKDVNKILEFYSKFISRLEIINDSNLNTITKAWAAGVKFDWEIMMNNYSSGGRYTVNWYAWNPGSAYPMNSFYRTVSRVPESEALNILDTLKEAVENKITLSKVVVKNNVNVFLRVKYNKELLDFYKDPSLKQISVADLIAKNQNPKQANLNKLYSWYATEYYKAADHGEGEDLKELVLYKDNKFNEVENSIELIIDNNSVYLYGLGLTQKDLEAKNVGIVGIQGNDKTTNGKKLYDAILKMSTTTNDTPNEVYQSGYKTSKTAANNMKLVAEKVAELIAGESGAWSPTIRYDADGVGSDPVQNIVVNIRDDEGNVDLTEFNKWLNQEQFFFGREGSSFYTESRMKELDSDPGLAKSREYLENLGYGFLKTSQTKYGDITQQQFYYGALEAFKGYLQFKSTTEQEGFKYFAKQVPTYGIDTYEYDERTEAGVGAYNGSTANFQFNADPYYSLPKWSVTSFANHESVMGHHNQIYYANKFLAKFNDENLGNIFDYTSYVEGWALFMEWFAIEAGYYGTPDYNNKDNDYYAMPVDFSYAKGITNFFTKEAAENPDNITDAMIKQIKDLHGGVYWTLVDSINRSSSDKEHAQKAVKLANMLQYFGALNEAQLRNMRRAVDTAFHGTGIEGQEDLPAGASIKDVRDFMKANSALGIGDITADSKRYLNLPGQATSYNAGKENMLALYDKVRKALKLSREEFINKVHGFSIEGENFEAKEHGYVQELLQYILMNGALPLGALDDVVNLGYNLKK
ncbi:DUF885 family protein [Metamycoplasma neophronis]|uniref:DUF885 family protein n=1 Tax=Metamycoplasma neophronis TaxID=872983 RepID=A0ABY2Z193_9BACT|nr:DUF885 family protein [Metamycoplasma neophronis]TPR54689.1 DUF885 family protein [Metamycoplasma neophronis]